jgi:cell pole-organizing protein PopZ
MTQPARSNEPSMEEILASIRRIIADDDATKPPPAAEVPKPAAPAVKPAVVAPPRAAAPPPSPPPVRVAPPEPEPLPAPSPPAEDKAALAAFDGSEMDEEPADILELTESMRAPMAPPRAAAPMPQFRTIEGGSDLSFDEPADSPPSPPHMNGQPLPQLLSASTSAAVDSAFNSLAQTVLVQNARTLEDLVREMLRPMLKTWLDENLPGLVERLVRSEIERVSRGR